MPVYEYRCTACGHRTDILQGVNDPAPKFCPVCGTEGSMRKVMSAPSVVFKGSGWARKDRASTKTKAAAKAEAGSESKSESGADAAKPAGAATDKPAASTTTDSD